METLTDFIFSGSKITLNGDCSHEIKNKNKTKNKTKQKKKNPLSPGKTSFEKPKQCIKKPRDITLLTKFPIVKAMGFPAVMNGHER